MLCALLDQAMNHGAHVSFDDLSEGLQRDISFGRVSKHSDGHFNVSAFQGNDTSATVSISKFEELTFSYLGNSLPMRTTDLGVLTETLLTSDKIKYEEATPTV